MDHDTLLVVGEICVDFTLGINQTPAKMRLGGIVNAARGLWACNIKYAVAAVCPNYLVAEAEGYLRAHGCQHFVHISEIVGAPNVFVIGDVKEVGHQGYENLLRDSKRSIPIDFNDDLKNYRNVVIFPGSFELDKLITCINKEANISIDIAYNVSSIEQICFANHTISNLITSTSSDLFLSQAKYDMEEFLSTCRSSRAKRLLLKENRGGSRLFDLRSNKVDEIPAILGQTVNSVGVGDAFSAVFAAYSESKPLDAAWRGMQVATKYAQTTFPDDLHRDVQRELNLEIRELIELGGTAIPWHERHDYQIYLAAPDFSYIQNPEVDTAVAALQYHNFKVRRPVLENGEAKPGTEARNLMRFYENDVALLQECSLIFAIPLGRDPGTLVEVGMAIAMGKPVVTFDPREENNNTMVICGSKIHSNDLDCCLNAVFQNISYLRKTRA